MTSALEEPHYHRLSVDATRERDDLRLVAASRTHEHRAQGHHQERTKEEIDFDLESEEGKLTLTLRKRTEKGQSYLGTHRHRLRSSP
jgi:hypothetical protein